MLAATNMLRPPPARIGSIGKSITLPRSVRLRVLLYVLGGLVPGFVAGAVVAAITGSFPAAATFVLGGGAIGGMCEVYKIEGEPVLTYLRRTLLSTTNRLAVNGNRYKVVVRRVDEGPPRGDSDPVEVARTGELVAFATPRVGRAEPGAKVYVGICPLDRMNFGEVTLLRAMVDVVPGSVDQYGYPVAKLAGRQSASRRALLAR